MRDYHRLAAFLKDLPPDPQARVHYDFFADALVWSDELPPIESIDLAVFSPAELRGVWHYRSSLMLNQPSERHRPAWEQAQEAFPTWPGFLPGRRDPELAATYRRLQQATWTSWQEAEARFDQAASKQTT